MSKQQLQCKTHLFARHYLNLHSSECLGHQRDMHICLAVADISAPCRCNASATLDRGKESQTDKERFLKTGKGNSRTLECWLREHQSCNPDWSHLTSTSLNPFRVPFGHRRCRSMSFVPCASIHLHAIPVISNVCLFFGYHIRNVYMKHL